MKSIASLHRHAVVLSTCLIMLAVIRGPLLAVAEAQSAVSLSLDPKAPGKPIPPGFSGLSFETGSLQRGRYVSNEYFFDSTNTQLLTLFGNLGIRSVRIGGNSVDGAGYTPSHGDIDALFRFVKAADLKVIYSLRLANGDPRRDSSDAKYVQDNYGKYLVCLAIGNEPNSYNVGKDPEITGYASFMAKWNKFASAVIAAVPEAKLGGPDNGNGSHSWASAFAQAQSGNRNVALILSHYEPGGTSRDKTAQQLIDEMLSPTCDTARYPACYDADGAIARSLGFGYVFTECNTHVATPTSHGENHSFATALFALDFMHWWAAHDCLGVNFHTGLRGFNAGLFRDPAGGYEVHPIGYGIAAFAVGGHGTADSLAVRNPEKLNLAAYAVTAPNGDLFVTIINREHGRGARDSVVRINAAGRSDSVMYLKAPNRDAAEQSGITLGGATIGGGGPWQGQWNPIDSADATGCVVTVEACSAAIVKLAGAGIIFPER